MHNGARLILAVLLTAAANAAAQEFVWTRSGSDVPVPSVLAVDPAGNLVVGGGSIVKFESVAGSLVWSHTPAFVGLGPSIALDASGNVLYADIERSSITSPTFVFARKLDGEAGRILWETSGTYFSPSFISPVVVDSAGNAIYAASNSGYYFRPCTWQPGSWALIRRDGMTGAPTSLVSSPYGEFDPYLMVMDRQRRTLAFAGRVEGARDTSSDPCYGTIPAYGGLVTFDLDANVGRNVVVERDFSPSALAFDAAGDILIAGSQGQGATRQDAVVRKYSRTTAGLLWSSSFPGDSRGGCANAPVIRAIVSDGKGDVLTTGRSCDAIGGSNIRTVKFSGATGAVLWTAAYAGSMPPYDASAPVEQGAGIVVDDAGDAIVLGTSVDEAGGANLRLIKYRGDTGSQVWTRAYDGAAQAADAGIALALGGPGDIFAGGSSTEQGLVTGGFVGRIRDASPALTATPSPLMFGGQLFGTRSLPQAVTIRNGGSGDVTISSLTASAPFEVTHDCATVAAGGHCTAFVSFAPAAAAPHVGSLSVVSSANSLEVILLGEGEKFLVTHYYRTILGRAPDAAGKAYWESEAQRMQGLGANVNEVWFAMAQTFFASAEYQAFNRDNTGFVTDLYNTFFNRPPDADGLAYWKGQLEQGMPREVALVSFMFSSEFVSFTQAIFGNAQVRREIDTVTDFYRGFLSRLPDDGGFTYWVGEFRKAQCAAVAQNSGAPVYVAVESISSAYMNSPEYGSRMRSNAQFVGDLYNAFLRRGGDLEGVSYWIGQLDAGMRTREAARQQFILSPEFNARVLAVIAEGCLQ